MKSPKKNSLEWTVFAISALLVLALVIVLLRAASARSAGPPDLRVELGTPARSGTSFTVPVRVRNEGEETAKDVRIEAALRSGETEVERAELVLEFVPAGSEREGFVVFSRDPGCCRMTARPVGYESP